jgi:serine/threonine protein kinase
MAANSLSISDPLLCHLGRVIDDRFELRRLIARGGTAGVFRARDRFTGETVAIKLLHGPDDGAHALSVRRFAREAEVIATLDHPNALPLIAYGLVDGHIPYIATEFLHGETLASMLTRGPLAPLTVLRMLDQVCDVLGEAHRRGIIHRDLKPENLNIEPIGDPDGAWVLVRVFDFGLASWQLRGRLTMKGALMGSPRYMAPEQALDRPVDGRSDIYSLGVVAYECLTGRAPFEAPTAMAELVKHVSELPKPVDQQCPVPLDPGFAELVMRMLEKRPSDRPACAEEIRSALVSIERRLDPEMDDERDTLSMAAVSVMRRVSSAG